MFGEVYVFGEVYIIFQEPSRAFSLNISLCCLHSLGRFQKLSFLSGFEVVHFKFSIFLCSAEPVPVAHNCESFRF